jgi:hypothetical protein
MRTIITLDDDLHRRAKEYAAKTGTTLTALVQEALRAKLAASRGTRKLRVTLPVFAGTGLQEGVSLDRMGDVLDRMDGLR